MKKSLKKSKAFTFLLSFLLLFQSCRTYYANAVSMDAAIKSGKQANVIYSNGSNETMEFDKIVKMDSTYYGIKKYHGELIKMPIPLENTTKKHKNISTFQIVLGLVGLVGLIYLVDKWNLGEFLFPED